MRMQDLPPDKVLINSTIFMFVGFDIIFATLIATAFLGLPQILDLGKDWQYYSPLTLPVVYFSFTFIGTLTTRLIIARCDCASRVKRHGIITNQIKWCYFLCFVPLLILNVLGFQNPSTIGLFSCLMILGTCTSVGHSLLGHRLALV